MSGLIACTGPSVSIGGVPVGEGDSGGASAIGSFDEGGTAPVVAEPEKAGGGPVDGGAVEDAGRETPALGSGGSRARGPTGGRGGAPARAGSGGATNEAGGVSGGGRGAADAGGGGMAGSSAAAGTGEVAGSGAAAGGGTVGSAVHSEAVDPPLVAPCVLEEPCRATFEWRTLTLAVRAFSGDGEILVGYGASSYTGKAYRLSWAQNTIEFIDDSANFQPTSTDLKGEVIVGYDLGSSPSNAVQQVGERPIERVPNSTDGFYAMAVSTDGHVIVTSDPFESGSQIVRDGVATAVPGIELMATDADGTIFGGDRGQPGKYTTVLMNQTGVVAEPRRTGDQSPIHVLALSADGSVAVGQTSNWSAVVAEMASDAHAYRWSNGVTELLPEPAGWTGSTALGCDATCGVIVGLYTFPGYLWPEGFVYTSADGMLDLASFLARRGLELPADFAPISIYVSADGKALAGEGVFVTGGKYPYYSVPWRATLDE